MSNEPTAPTGDGWEQTYRTSAMYAKDVKENELVVPLNTVIFLTGLLLSRTRQETLEKLIPEEIKQVAVINIGTVEGIFNNNGWNACIAEMKRRAGEMK